MGNQEQLAILYQGVGYKSTTHPLISESDPLSPAANFIEPTLGELEELKAEHQNFLLASDRVRSPLQPNKNWCMELADFLVMLKVLQEKIAPKFSVEEINSSVNGQFNGSFQSLHEKTINIMDGNVDRNFESIFVELLSLLKHVDLNLQAELYVFLTNTKLQLNREARFFQPEPGMNEADVIYKHDHAFKVLRLLRNHLLEDLDIEATLHPWITDFFVTEILDWKNSAEALDRLKDKITAFKLKIKDELSWSLTGQPENKVPDDFLEMKMLIVGARPIKNTKPPQSLSLQNQAANATLAGATVFWT